MLWIVGPCSETSSRGQFLDLAAHWRLLPRPRRSLHPRSFLGCSKLSAIGDFTASIYLFWLSAHNSNTQWCVEKKPTRTLGCLILLLPQYLNWSLKFRPRLPLTLLESSFFSLKASTCPETPGWVCRESWGPDLPREPVIAFFGRAGICSVRRRRLCRALRRQGRAPPSHIPC